MIHSRLHNLPIESVPPVLWKVIAERPLFVFSQETKDLLLGPQGEKSVSALIECGLVHIPYPEMIVQFPSNDGEDHPASWIVVLKERDGLIAAWPMYDAKDVFWAATGLAAVQPEGREGKQGFRVILPEDSRIDSADDAQFLAKICCSAAMLGVLMTHVSGLDRQVIKPSNRLNKSRAAKGKTKIRDYSYVRVGHVYDKYGKAHKHVEGDVRRSMPIHMRAGHVRNQPYGQDRALRKNIWIPPVLVNYKGEAPTTTVEKRVVL